MHCIVTFCNYSLKKLVIRSILSDDSNVDRYNQCHCVYCFVIWQMVHIYPQMICIQWILVLMNDRDLKKLNRVELLKMLIDQMTENETLHAENMRLTQQLQDRNLAVKNCGSIAEAALGLNGVFQAAEMAAKQYIDNAKNASTEADRSLKTAQQEAQFILEQARAEASRILSEARETSEDMLSKANKDSQQIRKQAMEVWESFISGKDIPKVGDNT